MNKTKLYDIAIVIIVIVIIAVVAMTVINALGDTSASSPGSSSPKPNNTATKDAATKYREALMAWDDRTSAQFGAQMQLVQQAFGEGDVVKLESTMNDLAQIYEEATEELAQMLPPAELRDMHREYLDIFIRASASVDKMREAVKAGNSVKIIEATDELNILGLAAEAIEARLANALGSNTNTD